jgi:hypothetical protein
MVADRVGERPGPEILDGGDHARTISGAQMRVNRSDERPSDPATILAKSLADWEARDVARSLPPSR